MKCNIVKREPINLLMKLGIMIHSGKVYKHVKGGVRVLNASTMQWQFIANSWYEN